jgi:hypothetical protein
MGQLQERGLAILIQNNTCKLFHPTRGLIMDATMTSNRMFAIAVVMPSKEPVAFFQTSEEGKTQL